MGREPTRKDLGRVFKQLSDDDQQRVLDFARRLSEGTSKSTDAAESLDGDGRLSYVAAADPDKYQREKKRQENRSWG